jgi:hypothetical protein
MRRHALDGTKSIFEGKNLVVLSIQPGHPRPPAPYNMHPTAATWSSCWLNFLGLRTLLLKDYMRLVDFRV